MTGTAVADTVDVTVRAIAAGGDGVADLPDGRVVFVPRTAPGDRARVVIDRSRTGWARAHLDELVEAGDARVEAPCPLFDQCGGCQLQHLPYSSQLQWKGRFVVDALERIGKLADVPLPEVVASPRTERYRTRMTFTLRRLRGGRVVAGLHALANPTHVLDVDGECLLPRARILDAWTALRAAWGGGAHRLPSGGRLRLTLRSTPEGHVHDPAHEAASGGHAHNPVAEGDVLDPAPEGHALDEDHDEVGGIELLVDGGEAGWRSGGLLDDVPGLVAVWHRPSDAPEAVLVAGASHPGGGDAFEQVNPEGADLLRRHVLEVVGAGLGPGPSGYGEPVTGGEPTLQGQPLGGGGAGAARRPAATVVDAYCGVGVVSRELASRGMRVTGIERNASAVAAARRDAPAGLNVVEGSVEDHLGAYLPCDLLIVNPPRAGLHDSLPDRIGSAPPERIVYVSCDPATLARDVGRLGDAYALTGLRCFDLFPHTAHVETVAVLDRAGPGTSGSPRTPGPSDLAEATP